MTIKASLATMIASLGLAAGAASLAHADGEKCEIATKGDSVIAKACASGGRKEAAKAMKTLVKAAKAKGTDFQCDSCHDDMSTYALTKNARDDLARLLAAAAKK